MSWRNGKSRRISDLRYLLSLIFGTSNTSLKLRVLCVLALVIAASMSGAYGPVALKHAIDDLATPVPGSIHYVWMLSLYILSQWFSRVVLQARGIVHARVERRLARNLSEHLFSHVLHLPFRFHQNRRTGAISQTLESGLHGFQNILQHVVFTFLPGFVEIATIVTVLSNLGDPVLLVLFAFAIPVYAGAFWFSTKRTTKPAEDATRAHIDASATMTDCILNYEMIKYFSAEEMAEKKVSEALKKTESKWVRFYWVYGLNGFGIATIFVIFFASAVLYAGREVVEGRMTLGTFVLVNTYVVQLLRPVELLGQAIQGISQGAAMLTSTFGLLAEPKETDSGFEPTQRISAGRIDFVDVCVSYRSDRPTLRGISFTVLPGSTLGIVGPSGAGKSTIVRLIMRLLDPEAGQILIDGWPNSAFSLPQLRKAIGVVPQDTVLFNESIEYNIQLGNPRSTVDDVRDAAKVAKLHDFIIGLPEGYASQVGERGVKLSGGERQRVSLARAALKRPAIYVFDEATSSLDSRTEKDILRNLKDITFQTTTVIIAHRLSTVVHADEIIVLDEGTIVERGTHRSMIHGGGRYQALWEAQQAPSAHASRAEA